MAIARTTFSLSDIAERWTHLCNERWTESAVLQEAKAGRLLVGIELPGFQGIVGHPVDSIETQGQLDMLLIGAVKGTGKDYLMTSWIPDAIAGFFWIRNYEALLSIELGESLRRVVEHERILINHHCAVRPIIESVKDIMVSSQNIIVRFQELEEFEQEHGIGQQVQKQLAPPVVAGKDTEPVPTPETESKWGPDDGPIRRRVEIIAAELSRDHADLMALPRGSKAELRSQLCSEMPRLFTESTFDKAWTDGTSGENPRFRLVNANRHRPTQK